MSKKNKILILSKEGPNTGAGKALYRIHLGLNANGEFSSKFLTWEGTPNLTNSLFVNRNFFLNKIYRRITNVINSWIKNIWGPQPGFVFSHNLFPNLALQSEKLIKEADIIFLGWIGFNYLSIGQFDLFKGKKIIWRFSDVWPFTGGCHVTFGCEKFLTACRSCPQLKPNGSIDLVSILWKIKKNKYRAIDIKFIAPSTWVLNLAKSSPLLKGKKIYYVPTGVDLEIFKPMNKTSCRQSLNIELDSVVIIFGSVDINEKRKGLKYLIHALKELEKLKTNIQLIVFGNFENMEVLKEINLPIRFLGRVEGDENLTKLYNTADVFLAPYIEDNLPNTVIESIACGLPIVGFNSGGMSDLVDHKSNGYLANTYDSADLARGINWVLNNLYTTPFLERSRAKSLHFSIENQLNSIQEILIDL